MELSGILQISCVCITSIRTIENLIQEGVVRLLRVEGFLSWLVVCDRIVSIRMVHIATPSWCSFRRYFVVYQNLNLKLLHKLSQNGRLALIWHFREWRWSLWTSGTSQSVIRWDWWSVYSMSFDYFGFWNCNFPYSLLFQLEFLKRVFVLKWQPCYFFNFSLSIWWCWLLTSWV